MNKNRRLSLLAIISMVVISVLLLCLTGCETSEISLSQFENSQGIFIYPKLSYGMSAEETSDVLNQEMTLESPGKYAPNDGTEVYSFGPITLSQQKFLVKLSFKNSKLSACKLVSEEKTDLNVLYENLKQEMKKVYHTDEQQELHSLEDMDGNHFDFERTTCIYSSVQQNNSPPMILSYLGKENEKQIGNVSIFMLEPESM